MYTVVCELQEIIEEDAGRKKNVWVRKWLSERSRQGASAFPVEELYL
jgi:hypothetical protein